MGLAWTSGVGFIAEVGQPDTAPEALNTVDQSGQTVSADADPLPSYVHLNSDGTVTFDNIGIDLGIYWRDQDPYYDGGTPNQVPRTYDGVQSQVN